MFGLSTIKLVMIAGAVLLVSALAYKAYDAIGDAREAKVVAKYEKQIAENEAKARAAEVLQRSELNQRSADYEQQLTDLRSNASPIPVIVRNCPRPRAVPSAATVTSEPSETPTPELGREDGRASPEVQLSNDLRGYAIEAQALALQCTQVIQAWPASQLH